MPVIAAVVGIAEAVGGAVAGVAGAIGTAAVGIGTSLVGAGAATTLGAVGTGIVGGLATAAVVGGAATSIASAAGAFNAKPSLINPNPTPTAAQTVNNSSTSNVNNLGRAALIETSGMGVQGSDPSQRYSLLGTSSGI